MKILDAKSSYKHRIFFFLSTQGIENCLLGTGFFTALLQTQALKHHRKKVLYHVLLVHRAWNRKKQAEDKHGPGDNFIIAKSTT
jgi:hypothetical protein